MSDKLKPPKNKRIQKDYKCCKLCQYYIDDNEAFWHCLRDSDNGNDQEYDVIEAPFLPFIMVCDEYKNNRA